MAVDFSRLNFFSKLDARARVFVLFGGVLGVILLIYIASKYLAGGASALGPSNVANVPQGLQTVPGGTQTQQFSKAVEQANLQRAQQASISGQSAVPTLVNLQQSGGQGQCIICGDQSVNVGDTLDDWVQKGKLSPDTAKELSQLALQNVSPEDFADKLNHMVADNKLTPEQARALLAQYQKQHANALAQDSAKVMDDLIRRGQLPLDAANELLAMQKVGASTTEYAAKLQEMVQEGKVTPATAQQLLAQYTQQKAKEVTAKGIATLNRMVAEGQLTPDAAKELANLQKRNVPVDLYKQTLDKMVQDGKLTPAVANKLLDDYSKQKGAVGPIATANQMLKDAEDAAFKEINDLMGENKISPEVGKQLTELIQKDVPLNEFRSQLGTLVQQNKLPVEIAKLKFNDYQAVKAMRTLTSKLADLQSNNASLEDYQKALKDLVAAGVITPDQAAELMKEYQAVKSQAVTVSAPIAPGSSTDAFAKLQQRLQQGAPSTEQPVASADEFEASQTQNQEVIGQAQQDQIQALAGTMTGQAQQLIAAWQPTPMEHKEGSRPEKPKDKTAANGASAGAESGKESGTSSSQASAAPLIKAGSIIFAVLDTDVNSDYPDSPVMATVVDGKYKGAKLMGKLTTTKGVAGQMDRVSLSFTLMNMDDWLKSKKVTAYAIDPDTARTVLASSVNYHYLQRFGAMMATSFVQGYANAISSSSSTTTTSALGSVSTTHPELSPSQKLATALGQMGTALGTVTQGYANIPPTVKVDSGVGLGILFMDDVS